MKMTLVKICGVVMPICENCVAGRHHSHGTDHREGPDGHRTCKNLSDNLSRQCCCDADWPQIQEAIDHLSASEAGNV